MSSRLPTFKDLPLHERRAKIAALRHLSPEAVTALATGGLTEAEADRLIENVTGRYALPLAVATNFLIDGADVLVPMVVEEPSIVAAASFAARLIRDGGGFTCSQTPPLMIGQVQLTGVRDRARAAAAVTGALPQLRETAAAVSPRLTAAGGGLVDVECREVPLAPGAPTNVAGPFFVVHLITDVRDAMGANALNTIAEALAPELERLTGGSAGFKILSNLADRRTVTVVGSVPFTALAAAEMDGSAVADRIVMGSVFAESDIYRAATHNKGIMNGVDAVMAATGNDWRAVEAGAHAYAARSGRYQPLATWRAAAGERLRGELTMPLAAGAVGGALRVHAGARAALEILGGANAAAIARAAACAGLAANLAALRALATVGIQEGHMRMYRRSEAPDPGEA